MKSIIFSFFLLSAATFLYPAFGQGNLQFNQTRLINFTTATITTSPNTNSIIYDSTTFVVPAGKTLKIENFYSSVIQNGVQLGTNSVDNFPSSVPSLRVFIDDVIVDYGSLNNVNKLPLWLPAGTYKLKIYDNFITNTTSHKFKVIISALEFNIIP